MAVSPDRPWFRFWPEGVPRHIDYPEVPLFQFLDNSAAKYPDNVAFSYRDVSLTYNQLRELTGKLACGASDYTCGTLGSGIAGVTH